MAEGKQEGLGDELLGTRPGELRDASGPTKGEFVPPPDVSSTEEIEEALPEQEEFWYPPARFGTVPVEANPSGWNSHHGFRKLYPQVMLPTQQESTRASNYSSAIWPCISCKSISATV